LTDHFYRENLHLDINRPDFENNKFIRSLSAYILATVNDDLYRNKVILEKKTNKEQISQQISNSDAK